MFQKRDDPYGAMEAGMSGGQNLSWAPDGGVGGDFTEKIVRQGFIRKVFGT